MATQSDDNRDAEKAHDRLAAKTDRLLGAAIANGDLALRTAVTINGGAAVAILAFVGALAGRDEIGAHHLVQMAGTLVIFAWGAGAAVAGMVLAYLTNGSAAECLFHHQMLWLPPYTRETDTSRKWGRRSRWLQGAAIFVGLASLALFIWGIFSVSNAAIDLVNAVEKP